MKTLLLFAHTFWDNSKSNKKLLESLKNVDNVKIHNLNTTYPDGKIDVNAELALLKEADRIIFQFPLFWFGTPSILKEWQDTVLTNILYGENPKFLEGKSFSTIVTTGGERARYEAMKDGVEGLLSPIYLSFKYLSVEVSKPFCVYQADANNLPLQEYLACFK